MKFGIHARTAGGLLKALKKAEALGSECVQLFSSNPNSWATKAPDPTECKAFCEECASLKINPVVLHTPYLLNLASPDDSIWDLSIQTLCYAAMRADLLEAETVVTHIGSHKGAGIEYGIKRIAQAVKIALQCGNKAYIALELGAGAGRSIGSTFPEIAMIMEEIGPDPRVVICIDTAHLYAAGYDISHTQGVMSMFDQMEKYVGHEKLKLVHLNDTIQELASTKDRHYHIGQGNVGIEGFRTIVNHPYTSGLPGIMETPGEDPEYVQNMSILVSLRSSHS